MCAERDGKLIGGGNTHKHPWIGFSQPNFASRYVVKVLLYGRFKYPMSYVYGIPVYNGELFRKIVLIGVNKSGEVHYNSFLSGEVLLDHVDGGA